jgi:hypothetical protein
MATKSELKIKNQRELILSRLLYPCSLGISPAFAWIEGGRLEKIIELSC